MKLNPDCIREILLTVEAACDPTHIFSYEACTELKQKFSDAEIKYHANQCNLSGFFVKYSTDLFGNWSVCDLTPKGHEFLANVRNDTVWNDVKSVCSKVGSKSLSAIAQIASSVISEIIKSQLRV